MKNNAKSKKNQVAKGNFKKKKVHSQEEFDLLTAKAHDLETSIRSYDWHDLETAGKFDKNAKIRFVHDNTLIVGCDIGSETHYIRAIDEKGIELSDRAFPFSNDADGFRKAMNWMTMLAAEHEKTKIVLGMEPTGHYWFCLAVWMQEHGVSVFQVNPYAVKQTKEIEDNSQLKDDTKDPKLIANLVKDGNYGVPYIPEDVYADLREFVRFRDQLIEERTRCMNRLHRILKIHFPEYKEALGKVDGAFALELLLRSPFPEKLMELGVEGIKEIWHQAKLRGRGYSRAEAIVAYSRNSIGIKSGVAASEKSVHYYVTRILDLDKELNELEQDIDACCSKINHAEAIKEIPGIGSRIMSGIIAEMGDVARFDDVKEIQKLSGLNLVACSSGKHKGETKISYRGRKRLRYWLFQAAKSAVAHATEFKQLHVYYTTREDNPLKKMQSLVAIACKILRVIFTLLLKGGHYDPERMLHDIHYTASRTISKAA